MYFLLGHHFGGDSYLNFARRDKCNLRSHLLGSLKHFQPRERRPAHAQKRGGGQAHFLPDEMDGKNCCAMALESSEFRGMSRGDKISVTNSLGLGTGTRRFDWQGPSLPVAS